MTISLMDHDPLCIRIRAIDLFHHVAKQKKVRTRGVGMRLICSLMGHRPDRSKVWNDGVDFRAPCVRCRAPMLRDRHSLRKNDGWRLFDEVNDRSEARRRHRRDGSTDAESS
jgi:hypothetical protein